MNNSPFPRFNNTYILLPERFFTRIDPTKVSSPKLIRSNSDLAEKLGIDVDWLESEEGIQTIAGNHLPEGSDPIATVYAGHQFGNWNPQLGDGRALLLGEILDAEGQRFDLQLKGSGPTPYSRGGDGRAPLGPVLREYIVSEAMMALGIPTTRALACVTTGDTIYRGLGTPSAVLARVAHSHIRIGHFQFFASRGDVEGLQLLADHVIDRHYSEIKNLENPYKLLFESVIKKQAELIAKWQLVGFIHGVMNTDNMLLSGETIDYGPCAFMDVFDPATVYSSIDQNGRYAYNNQPSMAHWNLMCLGQALLPLFDPDQNLALSSAQESLDIFPDHFGTAYQKGMNKKLGLTENNESGKELSDELLQLMHKHELDFTLTFRRLTELAQKEGSDEKIDQASVSSFFEFPEALQPWLEKWRMIFDQDETDPVSRQSQMLSTNPAYIPRNHLIEAAIKSAEFDQDFSSFNKLVDLLENPYTLDASEMSFAQTPQSDQIVLATFCGT